MSVKTKVLRARVKWFFTKPRFVQSYKVKKFILGSFLFGVNAWILWSLSLQLPEIHIVSGPMVYEQTVAAKDIAPVEEVKEDPYDKLIDHIFLHESSRGKNNYSKCETQGKYNRYGFGIPGNGSYLCFDGDEDREAVRGWIIQKKASGLSDNAVLCLYNLGKAVEDCAYLK